MPKAPDSYATSLDDEGTKMTHTDLHLQVPPTPRAFWPLFSAAPRPRTPVAISNVEGNPSEDLDHDVVCILSQRLSDGGSSRVKLVTIIYNNERHIILHKLVEGDTRRTQNGIFFW